MYEYDVRCTYYYVCMYLCTYSRARATMYIVHQSPHHTTPHHTTTSPDFVRRAIGLLGAITHGCEVVQHVEPKACFSSVGAYCDLRLHRPSLLNLPPRPVYPLLRWNVPEMSCGNASVQQQWHKCLRSVPSGAVKRSRSDCMRHLFIGKVYPSRFRSADKFRSKHCFSTVYILPKGFPR